MKDDTQTAILGSDTVGVILFTEVRKCKALFSPKSASFKGGIKPERAVRRGFQLGFELLSMTP